MTALIEDLKRFLDASPTPYHAVDYVKTQLLQSGFKELQESAKWEVEPSGKYFVTRRNASIIAFRPGTSEPLETGLRIIGAHTDSPTLKAKPRPEIHNHGYAQVAIEVYGGVLLGPWFDRDLSLAGRVSCRSESGIVTHLVDFKRPIAVIPNLAIHLDRTVNSGREINPQKQMRPILWQDHKERTLRSLVADELAKSGPSVTAEDILEYDLSFYDCQKAACVGIDNDFIASARLDNLLSCFAGLQALLDSDSQVPSVLALYDHEEVGSTTNIGANSNMLSSLLERLYPDSETRHRIVAASCLFSVDNAHGIHPNFADKHDDNHAPRLNHGPVIKADANQSYATSAETAALVRWLGDKAGVPLQSFVTRADMRCGSTIGPMSAAKTGIHTVDLGLSTFAMHSIRELGGVQDLGYMTRLLGAFLNTEILSF